MREFTRQEIDAMLKARRDKRRHDEAANMEGVLRRWLEWADSDEGDAHTQFEKFVALSQDTHALLARIDTD